jgi:hypothetical protein
MILAAFRGKLPFICFGGAGFECGEPDAGVRA